MSGDFAVRLEGVDKVYRLYANRKQAALDRMGLYRMRFWRPAPQWREFHALRGVSLEIERGERVGLVGRNGAGKTTLLKLLTGNFRPTRGVVAVQGSVQALMQTGLGFFPEFTGLENARSALLYSGLDGAQLETAVEEVVDFVELGDFIHQPIKTYSLGMAARLEFAVATAVRPEILIVDEVLGAGDGYFVHKSAMRMKALTRSGCTLLLVSHSVAQVLEFCDTAVWLDQGTVRDVGPVKKVLDAFAVEVAAPPTARAREAGGSATCDTLDLGKRPFLSRCILPQEPVDPEKENETEERLADGRPVLRWRGRRGLRFVALRDTAADGVPQTGKPLAFEFDCAVEASGVYQYRISVYDLTGALVCSVDSPLDAVTAAEGELRRVRVEFEHLLLGWRDYLVSFAIFDAGALQTGDPVRARVDLLSRSLHLRVRQTNEPTSPLLEYPGTWFLGGDGRSRQSRLSGWV